MVLDGVVDDSFQCAPCQLSIVDGGVITQELEISSQPDPTASHVLQFVVATGFDPGCIAWNSAGGDSVEWTLPAFAYDSATFGDGSFPEAASDGLFIVPESGPDSGADP